MEVTAAPSRSPGIDMETSVLALADGDASRRQTTERPLLGVPESKRPKVDGGVLSAFEKLHKETLEMMREQQRQSNEQHEKMLQAILALASRPNLGETQVSDAYQAHGAAAPSPAAPAVPPAQPQGTLSSPVVVTIAEKDQRTSKPISKELEGHSEGSQSP